jgi:hypothetical protein
MMSASPFRKPPRQPSQVIPSTPQISFLEEISKTFSQPEKELGGNPLSRTLRNESQFVFPDGRVMNFEEIITKLPSEENKRESIAIAESPTRPAPFSPMEELLQSRLSVDRGTMTSAKRETRPSTQQQQQQQQPKKESQQLVERETITTPSLMKELLQQSKPLAVAVGASTATSPEHFPTPPSRSSASIMNKRRNQQSHTEDYGFNPSSSSFPENDQIRPSSSQSNSSMSRPTTQSLLHILQRNDHLGSENAGLRSTDQEEFNVEKELKKNQRKWQLLQKLNNVSSNEMKMKEIFNDQPTFFSSEAANNSKTMTRHLLDEANPSPRDRTHAEESSARQYRPLTSSETTQNKHQSAMASNAKRVIDSGSQHHHQQQNRPQSSGSSSFQSLLHPQQQQPAWNKQQQQPQQLKTSLTGSSNLPWPMASPNVKKGSSIDNTSSKNQQHRPHSSTSKRGGGYDDDDELYSEFGL